MKLMESTFEVFAALFLAALFIEVSFLREISWRRLPSIRERRLASLGHGAGGSSDMMVKSALPYLKKYIPGEPAIVPEYMPGGGGVKRPPTTSIEMFGLTVLPSETSAAAWCRMRCLASPACSTTSIN